MENEKYVIWGVGRRGRILYELSEKNVSDYHNQKIEASKNSYKGKRYFMVATLDDS